MKATRMLFDKDGNIVNADYHFLLEDSQRTNNISMHTYDAYFCVSYEEALGQMHINRPEFKRRKINKVTAKDSQTGEVIYEWESEEMQKGREKFEQIKREQGITEF